MKKTVPYNTGKVLIGVNYKTDNRPFMTVADQQLQDALLEEQRRNAPDNIVVFGCGVIAGILALLGFMGWLA